MVFIWKCRIPRSQAHLCADGKLQPRRAVIEAILEVRVSFFLPLMGFCCGPEPGNKSQWNPGLTELFKVQLVLFPFVYRHRRWILLQQLKEILLLWSGNRCKLSLSWLQGWVTFSGLYLQQSWYQCLGNPQLVLGLCHSQDPAILQEERLVSTTILSQSWNELRLKTMSSSIIHH